MYVCPRLESSIEHEYFTHREGVLHNVSNDKNCRFWRSVGLPALKGHGCTAAGSSFPVMNELQRSDAVGAGGGGYGSAEW